jgi:hypothetical protein
MGPALAQHGTKVSRTHDPMHAHRGLAVGEARPQRPLSGASGPSARDGLPSRSRATTSTPLSRPGMASPSNSTRWGRVVGVDDTPRLDREARNGFVLLDDGCRSVRRHRDRVVGCPICSSSRCCCTYSSVSCCSTDMLRRAWPGRTAFAGCLSRADPTTRHNRRVCRSLGGYRSCRVNRAYWAGVGGRWNPLMPSCRVATANWP